MSHPLFPFYPLGDFNEPAGFLLGTLFGVAFGFVLERAGFGRSRNLAAMFYLTDARVLKVMFSAIVTALVGMAALAGAGILDLSKVTVPETYLWPQLVGGLVLGAGFIVSGYCPGTGIVAAASGNLDGAAALFGMMAGSLAFGPAWGSLETFYRSGAMGVVRLDQLLGVPIAVVAAAVVAMAVGAFLGAEALERMVARRAGEAAPASPAPVKLRVFGGFATVAAFSLVLLALPAPTSATVERSPKEITAVDLAMALVSSPDAYWVVDLRPPSAGDVKRIPGAMAPTAQDPDASFLSGLAPTRALVVYGDGDLTSLPPAARLFGGELLSVRGGWGAWQREILESPVPPKDATPPLVADFRMRQALHARFTGAAAAGVPVEIRRNLTTAAAPRKGGGC
jgi:hypothetical protein